MTGLDELLRLVELDAAELERWIGNGWVRPEREAGGYVFDNVDVARVRLIVEIRRECAIDDEALPVVLSLLDQVYALRRGMRSIMSVLEDQPEEVRRAVAQALEQAGG
jgi:chaperone modulatory protein CbpM